MRMYTSSRVIRTINREIDTNETINREYHERIRDHIRQNTDKDKPRGLKSKLSENIASEKTLKRA